MHSVAATHVEVSLPPSTPRRQLRRSTRPGDSMLDLRFLARRKTAAAIAILTMALALGANTGALSVVKAFLLTTLGFPESDRVVVILPSRNLPGRGSVVFNDAYPNYLLLRKTQHS